MKRFLCIVLSFALLLVSVPHISFAKKIEDKYAVSSRVSLEDVLAGAISEKSDYKGITVYFVDKDKLNNIQSAELTSALGGIAIYVLSELAGYLVDGAFVMLTGKEPGQWAADALRWAKTNVIKLYCNLTRVQYGINASGCVIVNPRGGKLCPQRSIAYER